MELADLWTTALARSPLTMWHSDRCRSSLRTRWNGTHCVPCIITVPPGREVTPNCGHDDEGNFHEIPTKPCKEGTFNDGSRDSCVPCSSCPPGRDVERRCSLTADTQCAFSRNVSPATQDTEPQRFTASPRETPVVHHGALVPWVVLPLLLLAVLLAAAFFYSRWKRGRRLAESHGRPSYLNAAFRSSDVEVSLDHSILSAPLQTVLDNLDVLEDLVVLLDPESRGAKNTKHLASLCSLSSTWITYAYSMKEIKSPLTAVLERVSSRNPDWTVGHLADLLRQMERNDAIAALAKLRPNKTDMTAHDVDC